MPTQVTEAAPLGTVQKAPSGRLLIGLITPGWGSSGYYSAEVCEAAATAKVFPAGTHMYLDHPTATENSERPVRSVRDLAAKLTTDAVWDGTRLVGEAQVFAPYRELLTDEDFANAIGTSIRAEAEVEVGEAEGRRGTIIKEIVEAKSVDFVTRPGRGGSILQVMESALPENVVRRAVSHGVDEATANDTREALSKAVKATHGADKTWTYVRDFDDDVVWFNVETEEDTRILEQAYTLDANQAAQLDGDPTEVRLETRYVPVVATAEEHERPGLPGRTNPPTPSPEEDHMGTIQVDEAEHGRLTEAAGRVPTLESERDTAVELAATRLGTLNTERAQRIIAESDTSFTTLESRGLLTDLPLSESGELDTDAFTTRVQEASAERATANGSGTVRGLGETRVEDTSTVTAAESDKAVAGAFGRKVQEG